MKNPLRYFNSSPTVIRLSVIMCIRYPLSLRQVEDLFFDRGIDINCETVRFWWSRFGPLFAARLRKKRIHPPANHSNWRWHLDEVFVKIGGEIIFLWRAVNHESEVLDAVLTKKRDRKAALNDLQSTVQYETGRWSNNRAENSHQVFQRRERAMYRFRSVASLQMFVSIQSQVQNHFNAEGNLIGRITYRGFRSTALIEWQPLVA